MKLLPFLLALGVATAAQAVDVTCQVKSTKGELVADAVISLVPLDAAAPAVAPNASVEIAQANQEFLPFVTVVQAGTRVVFPNHDTVQHHVYSLSKPKKFELPLYNPGAQESLVFDVAGLVTIGCNIHDWMISHVVVVPTPWFAKTDAKGAAAIAAPAGRYRLELWHPRLASAVTKEVTLTEGTAAPQEFTVALKSDRRVRRPVGGRDNGY